MIHLAATNTILQTIVEERLRGRVMSFYTMAFFGTVPIGSLLGGVMADRYGATTTVFASGLVCLAGSVWFAYKLPAIRARSSGQSTASAASSPCRPSIPAGRRCKNTNPKPQVPSPR